MVSPTQRTTAYCRERGMLYGIVERWDARLRIRKDLWGFVDMIILEGPRTIAAQVTGSSIWARRDKILFDRRARPRALAWISGTEDRVIEIWGWKRLKRKTKKGAKAPHKIVIQLERRKVTLEDFQNTEEEFDERCREDERAAARSADPAVPDGPAGDSAGDVGGGSA